MPATQSQIDEVTLIVEIGMSKYLGFDDVGVTVAIEDDTYVWRIPDYGKTLNFEEEFNSTFSDLVDFAIARVFKLYKG